MKYSKFVSFAFCVSILVSVPQAVQARYDGPHDVVSLNGNEFAIMLTGRGPSMSLKIFRAMGGSTWQYVGATTVAPGQRTSNGSLMQNIYFKGRKVRAVSGDLRIPFYRLYHNDGGDRVN